jgi:poly-D-alanine transfer protein DltD
MAMSIEEAKLILQWEKWYRKNGIESPFRKEVIEKAKKQLQSKGARAEEFQLEML